MQTEDKIIEALFHSIKEIIVYPFLIIDIKGNILKFNNEASSLFLSSLESKNFFELFDEESSQKINSLFNKILEDRSSLTETVQLGFLSGKTAINKLILSYLNPAADPVILCTIIPQDNKLSYKEITQLQVKIDNVNNLITNDKILNILSKIPSLFPFTFLGKEKLRKEIDKVDESFWVKDPEGNYIIVNKALAKSIGLNFSQIEGKPESSFIPNYLKNLLSSIDAYINESGNCILLEGIPLKAISPLDHVQTIEIPLKDAEEKVIAIMGITQKIDNQTARDKNEISFAKLFFDIPKTMACIDNKGIIRQTTKEFCKLFLSDKITLTGSIHKEILPPVLAGKIEQFLISSAAEEEFEITEQEGIINREKAFKIYLKRIYDSENNPSGIYLLIEEILSQFNQDPEKLTNIRGKMLDTLLQNNPEPIFIYDKENLSFLEVNNAALSLYGYSREEFLKMDLTDLYKAEDIQTLIDSSEAAIKEGRFFGPYRHKRSDSSSIFVEISKVTFKYNDKDAYLNIIRDINEQLKLEIVSQLFKTAFDNTEDLIIVTDASGFISYSNMVVKDVLGFTEAELKNTPLASLVRDEQRGIINSNIFQSANDKAIKLDIEFKKSNGNFINTILTAAPIFNFNNEIDSYNIIASIRKEIPAQKEEIEGSDITPKPEKIEEHSLSAVSSPLLSSIFHEILNPVNVIFGFVQEITESIDNPTPEQKEAANIINQNRANLLQTLNNIAEYSAIERNEVQIHFEEVKITDVIEKLQKDIKDLANGKEAELSYGRISSSLKFETDKLKFQNLLTILLRIIIRLNKEKKIFISAYQYDNDNFIISFKDNYSSISKYLLDNLNIIFTGDEGSLKNLSISKLSIRLLKKLMELLNGRFWMYSVKSPSGEIIDKNSTSLDYGLIFPIKHLISAKPVEEEISPSWLDQAETGIHTDEAKEWTIYKTETALKEEPFKESIEETESENLDLSKLSTLYLEDQIDSQLLFKVQMKELKEIKFAVSFEEAIPLLETHHFDFIVIDINLQGEYNGLDALKIIRKMHGYENIPVIAVTAYVLLGDKDKFIASGFNDFVSKPIFREKLIECLDKLFLLQS